MIKTFVQAREPSVQRPAVPPVTAVPGYAPRPTEMRREMRREVRLGCRVSRLGRSGLLGDRVIDLSPRGMLVLSDESIDPGSEVAVSFFATDMALGFDATATVARIVHGRRSSDPGRAIGLCFSLPAIARVILRGHLRRHPEPLPKRALPRDRMPSPGPDYARIIKEIASA